MLPVEANNLGSVFGGIILAEIDRVAYITASRHAFAPCLTASFDRVDFIAPVHVGDIVQLDAQVTFVRRTSMEVWIQVSAERIDAERAQLVGNAFVTMVAIDSSGRPIPVPELVLTTEEERVRFEEGRRRMDERRKTRAGPGKKE
ncbi:Thioesterase superfamily protein [mine drainage metagenome]|uniref:Thioesterase superfamily protein n=1 Tax=mine drainage metagenome TaxID=410659 RepID=T0YNL7_9ZZZZ